MSAVDALNAWSAATAAVPVALPAPDKAEDYSSGVVYQSAAPLAEHDSLERAGKAYHYAVLKSLGVDVKIEAAEEAYDQTAAASENVNFDDGQDLKDYYGLLGIEPDFDMDLKTVQPIYRARAMLYHPDKAPPEHRELAEARYKAMQQAFETFSNLQLKRTYDSTLPFDESVPTKVPPAKFYKTFAPLFEQNARFSEKQPVPKLGDADSTDYDDFYDFWFSFKSWRDFAHLHENKLEQAVDRYDRRQMDKENKKATKAAKAEEAARVRSLVESAYACDPRVQADKQKIIDARNAKKQAKLDAAQAIIDAERAEKEKAEKEAADKAAAAKAAQKNAKFFKDKIRKAKSATRKLLPELLAFLAVDGADLAEQFEKIFEHFTPVEQWPAFEAWLGRVWPRKNKDVTPLTDDEKKESTAAFTELMATL